ncbi:MAG TPA: acyl-CoA dehydrogenase family protein [Nocardioides sp.]
MELGLTHEQKGLAATVRSLLDKKADSQAVRAAMASPEGYDRELWRTLCEQIGAAALAIPEVYDGAGFGLFETGVVLEELGRSLAPSPLLASVLAAEAVLASGDEAAAQRLLPQLAAGEVATIAWDAITKATSTRAPIDAPSASSDGSTISGTVDDVLFGDQAAVLLVVAQTADGPALFEVDPALATARPTPAMDPTLRLASLTFDKTPATRISGDATAALRRAHLAGSVAVTCLQVGCAQRALEMTVAYTKERQQFGRPIGSFQALKHRMADLLVQVETSRSVARAATYAVATYAVATAAGDPEDTDTLTAAAASYCTDALDHVASETIQLHGGIAITWEHDAHLVFKRAHSLHHLFGRPHERRSVLMP